MTPDVVYNKYRRQSLIILLCAFAAFALTIVAVIDETWDDPQTEEQTESISSAKVFEFEKVDDLTRDSSVQTLLQNGHTAATVTFLDETYFEPFTVWLDFYAKLRTGRVLFVFVPNDRSHDKAKLALEKLALEVYSQTSVLVNLKSDTANHLDKWNAHNLWKLRMQVLRQLLDSFSHMNFILSDVDAIWLKDPAAPGGIFNQHETSPDIVVSRGTYPHECAVSFEDNDQTAPITACLGLALFRNTPSVHRLLADVETMLPSKHNDDQKSLNCVLTEQYTRIGEASEAEDGSVLSQFQILSGEITGTLQLRILPYSQVTRICDEEILSTDATVAHCYVHPVEEHEHNKTGDKKMENFERFGFIDRMRSNQDGQLILPHSETFVTGEYEEHEAYAISLRPKLKLERGPIAYHGQSTLCVCPKCGSASFYGELYRMTHDGKSWPNENNPVQNLGLRPWKKALTWRRVDWQSRSDWRKFVDSESIALIRDPKERLLSVYRDKVACGAHKASKDRFVNDLIGLSGATYRRSPTRGFGSRCLNLDEFVQVLYEVHAQGKQQLLNRHLRPQHLLCFLHASPDQWAHVIEAKDPNAACILEAVVFGEPIREGDECALSVDHANPFELEEVLAPLEERMLDAITKEEYEVLSPYLVDTGDQSSSFIVDASM